MKRLAVLLMLPALAMCMLPGVAAADDDFWANFAGIYKVSASGSCLHSSLPYFKNTNGRWEAPIGSQVYAGALVANGTWIFRHGNKGTYSQTIYATILPGGDVSIPVEVRVLPANNVAFHYAITPAGDITVTQDNNGIQFFGSISMDKKTMTLLSANNVQANLPAPFWNTICNVERTLIKVGDE